MEVLEETSTLRNHEETGENRHDQESSREKLENVKIDQTPLETVKCEKSEPSLYKYVSVENDLDSSLLEINNYVKQRPVIAVDMEGVNLSRSGSITLLALATEENVYLFDILVLGRLAFYKGLKAILENRQIDKLMFDCREDSDALWHLFGVKLAGVHDIQLLEIISKVVQANPISTLKRSARENEIIRLESLMSCMYHYAKDLDAVRAKQKVAYRIKSEKIIWAKRPLTQELLTYAAYDAKGLFKLFEVLKTDDEGLNRLRIASELYGETKRTLDKRSYNEYDRNPYLPIDIIPMKGLKGFPKGYMECLGCHRDFPEDEFSNNQKTMGNQKCRVCKKIKSEKDRVSRYLPSRLERVPFVSLETREPTRNTTYNNCYVS